MTMTIIGSVGYPLVDTHDRHARLSEKAHQKKKRKNAYLKTDSFAPVTSACYRQLLALEDS